MFVLRAKRRSIAVLGILLATALLLAMMPPASVSAQSPLDRATETLRGVPGLRAQTQNLHITAETDPDSPALWAAMGQVTLNKKLRDWFKPLVNGKLGWGQLPPVGTPVWATFIWLKERPTAKGPKSIVVHQGYSDGSKVVSQGPDANPYEVDDTVDSYGLWWREDVGFYPLGASSTVGPNGVNWYDSQFVGAGGVSKKVMANVVPSDGSIGGGGGGGGGGNNPPGGGGNPPGGGGNNPPGGNPPGGGGNNPPGGDGDAADPDQGAPNGHLVVEEREPKKDPDATRRDHIVWYNGAYRVMRDFAPGDDLATCVRTTGTTAGDGTPIVEVTIQTLLPLDPAELGKTIRLQVFDDNGNVLGEVATEWRSHTPTGPFQGSFVYRGVYALPGWAADARSIRLSPDADVLAASLEAPGPAVAGALAGARIALAHSANSVAIGGVDGAERCGTLVSGDFDSCSAEIVAALTNLSGDMAGGGVVANTFLGPNGMHECHLTRDGEFIGVLAPTGELETLEQVPSVPGCPMQELSAEDRKVIQLTCELFQVYLWLQEVPGLEAEIGVDDGELYLDTIMSAIIWPTLPEPLATLATTAPFSLGEGVPIAAVEELIDSVDAAARAASWRWSVPEGESA